MDDDASEAAMAQMMGFSSFGAQDRPQKKRRYNPGADAAISAPPLPESSTGSNSVPVGVRKSAAANADEIDLDDDDEREEPTQVASVEPTAADASSTSNTATKHLPPGLPQRPAPGTGFAGSEGSQRQHGRGGHRGQQQRNEHPPGHVWYEGYYDTLSNRNPWEKLESVMGLKPRGTWVSHNDAQSTGT